MGLPIFDFGLEIFGGRLPTSILTGTLTATGQEITSPILNTAVAKGTWTASGTWTIPAVTLGGNMTVTGYSFDVGAENIQINTTGGDKGVYVRSTQDGATGGRFEGRVVSTSPAVNDALVRLAGVGYDTDTPQNLITYGYLDILIEDATPDHADGKLGVVLWSDNAYNEALRLSGVGVLSVDLGGSGSAAQVDLFDEYDDALVLRQGIQQNNRELLANIGVLERKDTGSGYMMKLQPMVRLLAGGIYQTRQMLEDTRDEMRTRLENVERKLLEA